MPLLVLLGIAFVATPFDTEYLLVKQRKLREQLKADYEENSRGHAALQREDTECGDRFYRLTKPGVISQQNGFTRHEGPDRVNLIRKQRGRPCDGSSRSQEKIGWWLKEVGEPLPQGWGQVASKTPRLAWPGPYCMPSGPCRVMQHSKRQIDASQRPLLDLAARSACCWPPRPVAK